MKGSKIQTAIRLYKQYPQEVHNEEDYKVLGFDTTPGLDFLRAEVREILAEACVKMHDKMEKLGGAQ